MGLDLSMIKLSSAATQTPRQLGNHYYALAVAVLSYYSTTVSPYMASLTVFEVMGVVMGGFILIACIKALLEPWFIDAANINERTSRQFYTEVLLYVVAGAWITLFTIFILEFPISAGNKLVIGCLAFGTFAAIDIAILRERQTFNEAGYRVDSSRKTISITKKLFIAFCFIVSFTSIIMAMTVVNEVDYMVSNMETISSEHLWQNITVDILFVVGMVLLLSLQIIRSYSENLRLLFEMQISVLQKVEAGNLDVSVPIVTRDEFGEIANKTNKTIRSLKESREEERYLFESVNHMRNYNESILKSLNDGVITFDIDKEVVKSNQAAGRLLGSNISIVGKSSKRIFSRENRWIAKNIDKVIAEGVPVINLDCELILQGGKTTAVNLNTVPLLDLNDKLIGAMLVFEDITEEKRVRTTMSRYMSKEVVDQLLEGDGHKLGGSAYDVTVLFSDIRGFTGLSEELGARETVSMLNEYFSEMADIVSHHKGMLDKYIGDAIMAVFGAPFSSGSDADNAVNAAIHMMNKLKELNIARKKQKLHRIDIGIGLSSGEVVVGNIGSPKRMDFTVIGDTVNLASRLEGANKMYGSQILISESTKKGLMDKHLYREVDSVRVKGQNRPVAVYEVLDFHDEVSFPNMELTLQCHKNGMAAYKTLDWEKAIACFEAALKLTPNDGPSLLYLERCQYFLHTPPIDDWDGVWTMESK